MKFIYSNQKEIDRHKKLLNERFAYLYSLYSKRPISSNIIDEINNDSEVLFYYKAILELCSTSTIKSIEIKK